MQQVQQDHFSISFRSHLVSRQVQRDPLTCRFARGFRFTNTSKPLAPLEVEGLVRPLQPLASLEIICSQSPLSLSHRSSWQFYQDLLASRSARSCRLTRIRSASRTAQVRRLKKISLASRFARGGWSDFLPSVSPYDLETKFFEKISSRTSFSGLVCLLLKKRSKFEYESRFVTLEDLLCPCDFFFFRKKRQQHHFDIKFIIFHRSL